MVDATLVEDQLKKIKFNTQAWNRAETKELSAIILPDEKIFECSNGWYEGGFALMVATNLRILLIDKKPFKYLTVEDIRFDMISEIDYSHRLLDARIHISTGIKNLWFRSTNQQRLRKLITHVQHRMAEIKTEQMDHSSRQQEHLKQIDQRLQTYLLAQFQQNQSLRRRLSDREPLDEQFAPAVPFIPEEIEVVKDKLVWDGKPYSKDKLPVFNGVSATELYEAGHSEVFKTDSTSFSKLPAIFKHRQFGRTLLRELLSRPIEVTN